MPVRDVDKGAQALIARLGRKVRVNAGVVGSKAEEQHKNAELSVGELAAIHELGLGVPERSFVRSTVDAQQSGIRGALRKAARLIFGGLAPAKAAEQIGEDMARRIRAAVVAGVPPPLAQATIVRKGKGTPLIDTGQLLRAIGYEVTRD